MAKPNHHADANLLFGVLAFQNGFITRDQLVAGMQAWVENKQLPLDEHLLQVGAIAPEIQQLLQPLVAAHIRQHGGDAERSLAAISSASEIKRELKPIQDDELQRSVAGLKSKRESREFEATLTLGASSSGGTRFHILRPHARGGLGEVFVARDTELGREVALKEIQFDKDDSDSRARFTREAEITGGLEHPGIVPVYGLSTYDDGRPFYAMRFIRGKSLQDAIREYHAKENEGHKSANKSQEAGGQPTRGPETGSAAAKNLELRRLLQRFIDVCEAIDYAHSRGVLHRDLKPGNVMLGRYGETLVVDWGLAKSVEPSSTLTSSANLGPGSKMEFEPASFGESRLVPSSQQASDLTILGSALGTPAYMSPEQAQGRLDLMGPASDVFSLGATLYQILTGRPPYTGQNVFEVQQAAQRCDYPAASSLQRQIPIQLDAICRKALAAAPGQRYASVRQLAADIEQWLADEPVTAHVESSWERATRWLRRNRTFAQGGGIALMLVTAVSIASALLINREKVLKEAAFATASKAQTEKLAAVEAQSRAQSLAALTRSFEMGLNAENWNAEQQNVLNGLVKDLRTLDPAGSAELTARINERWAAHLVERIRSSRIDEAEFAAIGAALAELAERDRALANPLQQELAARATSWQTQFSLEAPFTGWEAIFAADQVKVGASNIELMTTTPSAKRHVVRTKVKAAKAASLETVFAPSWWDESEIGAMLLGQDGSSYEFVLLIPPPTAKVFEEWGQSL